VTGTTKDGTCAFITWLEDFEVSCTAGTRSRAFSGAAFRLAGAPLSVGKGLDDYKRIRRAEFLKGTEAYTAG
jgi:hypothetical protein